MHLGVCLCMVKDALVLSPLGKYMSRARIQCSSMVRLSLLSTHHFGRVMLMCVMSVVVVEMSVE